MKNEIIAMHGKKSIPLEKLSYTQSTKSPYLTGTFVSPSHYYFYEADYLDITIFMEDKLAILIPGAYCLTSGHEISFIASGYQVLGDKEKTSEHKWPSLTDYEWEVVKEPADGPKYWRCECGAASVNSPRHSDWCALYEAEK
jgi:hypothetical protein